MSKCEQCGEELVWVGSMQDGKLECPNCLDNDLWADGGFDDVAMQPMEISKKLLSPDLFKNIRAKLAKQEKFTFADPYHATVKCPVCGHVCQRAFMGFMGDTIQCPHCGVWAEIEQ